jgi:hypothetical protein
MDFVSPKSRIDPIFNYQVYRAGATMQALTFLLAIVFLIICLVILGFAIRWGIRRWKYGPLSERIEEQFPSVTYKGPGGLQRVAMSTAETASVIVLLVITLAGAITGSTYGKMFAVGAGQTNNQDYVVIFGIIGALGGFFTGSLLTAFLFTLSAIEKNTRHTAMMFEKLANRGR